MKTSEHVSLIFGWARSTLLPGLLLVGPSLVWAQDQLNPFVQVKADGRTTLDRRFPELAQRVKELYRGFR
jgi:hypothetical protein